MTVLQLRTGCRLHFGLMELALGEPMRFSGLGLMLDQPGFQFSFTASDSRALDTSRAEPPAPNAGQTSIATPTESNAEYESRIRAVMLQRQTQVADTAHSPVSCHVRLLRALPLHSGLGAGTQLAAGVAAGLELFWRARSPWSQRPTPYSPQPTTWRPILDAPPKLSVPWLSQYADRGLRSAVGLVGFLNGGIILDKGYSNESLSQGLATPAGRPLNATASPLPIQWRVVLVVPQQRAEVSGAKEAEVMAELGSLPNPHRQQMLALARRAISLATENKHFVEFTNCLDQYMQFGAQLFTRYQGGMYNGVDITEAVHLAQATGLRGVGQSSWGPTVFGFAESQSRAEDYAEQLLSQRPDWSVRISTPASSGAQYRLQPSPQ